MRGGGYGVGVGVGSLHFTFVSISSSVFRAIAYPNLSASLLYEVRHLGNKRELEFFLAFPFQTIMVITFAPILKYNCLFSPLFLLLDQPEGG